MIALNIRPIGGRRSRWHLPGLLSLLIRSTFARRWFVLSPQVARRPAAVKMNHFCPARVARCPSAAEIDTF
ncbi:MAG: hypothetical protein IPO81_27930 [Kouleothrix sp.]|nr:hypothetical protein [Kouleothrix sp.]